MTRPIPARAWPALAVACLALLALASCRRPAERAVPGAVGTVGAVAALPSPAGEGSAEPNLALGPDGRVYMSWIEPRGAGRRALLWAALDGDRWTEARAIADSDSMLANWADFPVLLPLPGGRMAAAWLYTHGGTAYDVHLTFSADSGATWSRPVTPHRDGTVTEHGFVSLLPEGDGVRAVWLDGRNFAGRAAHGHDEGPGADMTLRTAVIGLDGSIRSEQVVDGRVCDCCQTSAVAVPGGALVAYRDRGADETRDITLARLEGGSALEPRPAPADGWVIPGCPVNGPALDADSARVVLAWYAAPADSPRVRAAFSPDGGRSFGAPVRVDDGKPLGRVDALLLADGSALVSWIESGVDTAHLRVRRVTSGGAGPALTVAGMSPQRASGFPRMVRAGDRIVLAWTDAAAATRVRVASLTPGR